MAGSIQYHEKCVCGAMITLTNNYDFIPSGEVKRQFETWQKQHSGCLALFHQVQQVRAKQLIGPKYKLLGVTNGQA